MKHRLRGWTGALGVLCALGLACDSGPDKGPTAHEREARSQVVRELMASREKAPSPPQLQSQRKDLQAEVNPDQELGQGGSGQGSGQDSAQDSAQEPPEASTTGLVTWVGNDELLVRDGSGVERDVRVGDGTRFHQGPQSVSRRSVSRGSQVRVAYDVEQGEWVAREVELLRKPAFPPDEAQPGAPGPEGLTQPAPR